MDDVWNVVDLLIEEVKDFNQDESGDFDVDKSLIKQLPFFCCTNVFYTHAIKRDIERYSYCKENNVSPYNGSYGDQPAKWVDKYFIMKSAFAKQESMMIEKTKAKAKSGK